MLLQEIPNIISRVLPHLSTPDAVTFSMTTGGLVEFRVPLTAWATPASGNSTQVLANAVPAGMFSAVRFVGGNDVLVISTNADSVNIPSDMTQESIRSTIGALAGSGQINLRVEGTAVVALSTAYTQAVGAAIANLLGGGGLPSHIEGFSVNRQQLLVSFTPSGG